MAHVTRVIKAGVTINYQVFVDYVNKKDLWVSDTGYTKNPRVKIRSTQVEETQDEKMGTNEVFYDYDFEVMCESLEEVMVLDEVLKNMREANQPLFLNGYRPREDKQGSNKFSVQCTTTGSEIIKNNTKHSKKEAA